MNSYFKPNGYGFSDPQHLRLEEAVAQRSRQESVRDEVVLQAPVNTDAQLASAIRNMKLNPVEA